MAPGRHRLIRPRRGRVVVAGRIVAAAVLVAVVGVAATSAQAAPRQAELVDVRR